MISKRTNKAFRLPKVWLKPNAMLASLAINLLALALPMVILQVYDRIIPRQAIGSFSFLLAGMVVVVFLDVGLKIFRTLILSWEGARFDHRESMNAMGRILDADTIAYRGQSTGYYLDKMQALEKIQAFYSGQSILIGMDIPFAIVFLILIAFIAGPMVFVPVVLLAVFIGISIFTGRKLRQALETRASLDDRRQDFIIESLQGIHTIKSMAMESLMLRRYERLQGQSADSVYQLSRINSVVQGMGATFSQLAMVSFVGIGAIFVTAGELSVGALAAGSMLSSRVLQPGLSGMNLWTQFQTVRIAREKVESLFDLPAEHGSQYQAENGIKGKIELNLKSFRYPEQAEDQLSNIYLRLEPGESIAISGSNGAGKSTLIGMLAGFLHPQKGEMMIDGRDIQEYDIEFLRSQIGIVPQHGVLFEGTILENMTLYREGEAIDEAIGLARMLGLDEVISQLPDGLDTQVGGAAVDTLPEGVRQKIIMVRSLVGHPKIILFDEANANFDTRNDNRLLRLLNHIKSKHTMVIVTHRPSFQRLCDSHFEISNGGLREVPKPRSEQVA